MNYPVVSTCMCLLISYSQETNRIQQDQSDSLLTRHPGVPEEWHWSGPECEVCSSIDGGGDVEEQLNVNTCLALHVPVPGALNRIALEDDGEDRGNSLQDNEDSQSPHDMAEVHAREDAQVGGDDRQLGQAIGERVAHVAAIENLDQTHSVLELGVRVLAQNIHDVSSKT